MSEAQVEEYSGALATVGRLLKARGVRSYTAHTVSVRLSDERGAPTPYRVPPRLHAPELVVCGDGGVVATVTVGARSGCYLVTLPDSHGPRVLREPGQVANLILTGTGALS